MPGAGSTLWVALLRGINVGGHRRVQMATLRDAAEAAGGCDVSTHIQSGNLLLRHATDNRVELTAVLESAMAEAAGFAIPVILRSGTELADLVQRWPLAAADAGDDRRRYASFLGHPAQPERVDLLLSRAAEGESLSVTDSEVCAAIRRDVAKPAFADLERILRVPATARAWNVVQRLAELATR